MSSFERDLVILVCGISAGIHAALTPEHLREGLGAGFGFLVATVMLAGLAAALTRSAEQPALVATILTLVGLLAAYALAITSGLPVVHPEREPIDGLAVATKAIELAGLLAAAHLLLRGRSLTLTRPERTLT